ncbi:hypothetical protein PQ610_00205 [Tardisphaera miroshnichenkoae]
MAKVVFLITSGRDDPEKFSLGLTLAERSFDAKRYEDVKVLFFGPSESYIAEAQDKELEAVNRLIKKGVIDSACVFVANQAGAAKRLTEIGVQLQPIGERLSHYVNQGYLPITF